MAQLVHFQAGVAQVGTAASDSGYNWVYLHLVRLKLGAALWSAAQLVTVQLGAAQLGAAQLGAATTGCGTTGYR